MGIVGGLQYRNGLEELGEWCKCCHTNRGLHFFQPGVIKLSGQRIASQPADGEGIENRSGDVRGSVEHPEKCSSRRQRPVTIRTTRRFIYYNSYEFSNSSQMFIFCAVLNE